MILALGAEPMSRYHYRAALYLSTLVALTTLAIWSFIAFRNPPIATRSIQVVATSVIIPFGVWIGSNFVRYVGAALLVFWAGALIWPLISSGVDPDRLPLQLLFVLSACLCLATAWLLLLSRKFRTEFAEEQKQQPKYKTYRKGLLYAAIAAMVIATLNDIYNLVTTQ
jgi:dolichyl-phosphate-mannose--protein O-mannosyl transferase